MFSINLWLLCRLAALERPVTHQCSATIKDPAEIEPQWTGYMQAATLVGLTLTGLFLAFKLKDLGKRKNKTLLQNSATTKPNPQFPPLLSLSYFGFKYTGLFWFSVLIFKCA
jgi:hypothetical protein